MVSLNKANLRLAATHITGHVYFLNHLVTVGFLLRGISCRLCGQASEYAKHKLLECKRLDIRRMRIFEGKQLGEEGDAGSGYKILEHVKFTGIGAS